MKKNMKKNEIDLSKIAADGEKFEFDNLDLREAEELQEVLVNNESNFVKFKIKPIDGEHYHLKSAMHFETPTLCSRCGVDFNYNFEKDLEEFLSTELEEGEDQGFLLIKDPHRWNWANFVRETVELEIPYQNYKYGNKCLVSCKHYDEAVKKGLFGTEESIAEKKNPFSSLKKVSVKKTSKH